MNVILRLDIWIYVEARIESIALTSTLIPLEEGDEPGEVSVQPAAKMRITRSTNKRSGVKSFIESSVIGDS
jgi:hypothetical protein